VADDIDEELEKLKKDIEDIEPEENAPEETPSEEKEKPKKGGFFGKIKKKIKKEKPLNKEGTIKKPEKKEEIKQNIVIHSFPTEEDKR